MEENIKTVEKRSIYFYFLLILLFLIGLISPFVFGRFLVSPKEEIITKDKTAEIKEVKPIYSYHSQPPLLALNGKIEEISGEVEKQERDKENWEKVGSPSAILQGENLRLGNIARVKVSFENQAQFFLEDKAEVWFINLIPDNFLVEQKNGTAYYKVLKSLSIRTFNSLIFINEGEIEIKAESQKGRFNLSVFSGEVKLSFVDSDNETQVYDLLTGDQVIYDSFSRTVIIK